LRDDEDGSRSGSPSSRQVDHLANPRAARFLDSLAAHPFLCIVVEGDRVKLYEKDMAPEALEDLLTALERTIPERAADLGSEMPGGGS
jgi:GAF domain-containing protein